MAAAMNNYPLMSQSEWDKAPFSQSEARPVSLEVCASITLSKSTVIPVRDFRVSEDDDCDSEDGSHRSGVVTYDFSESNLLEAFRNEGYTIPDLLKRLRDYAVNDLSMTVGAGRRRYLERLIEACDGWTVDEEEVIEE